MDYLIGIQPTQNMQNKIESFSKSHSQPCRPYITLIPPTMLNTIDSVGEKLQTFGLIQAEFNIVIAGPNCNKNKQLYLSVLPGAVNFVRQSITSFMKLKPEAALYRPHITLVWQDAKQSLDLQEYLGYAKAEFAQPESFTVDSLTLFALEDGKPARIMDVVPLTGR